MTLHKALLIEDDKNRYCGIGKAERGLESIENSIYTTILRLKEYAKKSKEVFITAISNRNN